MYANQCAVPECQVTRKSDAQPFPKNPDLCNQWKEAIKNPVINGLDSETLHEQYFVCAEHFRPEDFRRRSLSPVSKQLIVPSLRLKANEEHPEEQISNQANVIHVCSDECAVPGCIVSKEPGALSFPRHPYYCSEEKSTIENQLIHALDTKTLHRNYFVCAKNFMLNAYQLETPQLILKHNAVPRLCLEANGEHPEQ